MTLRIMLDLETMSTAANAAIVQIGACANDGRDDFSIRVRLASSVKAGLSIDPYTVEWWLTQSDAARTSVFGAKAVEDRRSLEFALHSFANWLGTHHNNDGTLGAQPVECELWALPAQFDVTILGEAYRALNMTPPWHYRAPRCLRTLTSLFPDVPRIKSELEHDALADAKAQMQYLEALLARLPASTVAANVRDGLLPSTQ